MSSKMNRIKQNRRNRKSPMFPIILALGGLVLMVGALFTIDQSSKAKAPVEGSGSPSLKVDKEKVDLGAVKLGQTVQVDFELTNVGNQTLRFSNLPTVEVKQGC